MTIKAHRYSLSITVRLFLIFLLSAQIAFAAASPVAMPSPGSTTPLSGDRSASELQQFTSNNHVLGFAPDTLHIVGVDRALKIAFVGANPALPVAPSNAQVDNKTPVFTEIDYQNLWNGVDLHYDKGDGIIRSTYTVKSGADVGTIKLAYNMPVTIDSSGALKMKFDHGEWVESAPVAWQEVDGKRKPVQVAFHKTAMNQVGFSVGSYNKAQPLIIDPTLNWNTVLGAGDRDSAGSINLDSNGNIIVVGSSKNSWGNPLSPHLGGNDGRAVVAKLNPSGGLVWHTFLGSIGATSAVLDDDDNIYITGIALESWGNPIDPYIDGCCGNVSVAKLDTHGALQWNTFFGNSSSYAIALDNNRNIIVTGSGASSWGTPINPHSGGANHDMFVAKLNQFGILQWNTFFGSTDRHDTTSSNRIAVDDTGNIFITGNARGSWGNPIRPYSEPDTVNSPDVFAAKISSDGILQWNTFLGGTNGNRSFDTDGGISLDSLGNLYILGRSESGWGEPVNPHLGGSPAYNCFVAKLAPTGNLVWHSFYHWQGDLNYHDCSGTGLDVDPSGNIAFTGTLQSSLINSSYFVQDIVVAELDSEGALQNSVILGTPLVGGDHNYRYNQAAAMIKDSNGSIYITGSVNSDWGDNVNIGPASPSTYYDILVAKIDGFTPGATRPIANAGPDQSVFVGDRVTLDGSQSTDPNGDLLTYSWRFLSVPNGSAALLSDSASVTPGFDVDLPGSYVLSLVVNDGMLESEADTVTISTINVAPVADAGPDQAVFKGDTVTLDAGRSSDADGDLLTYLWSFSSLPSGSIATIDNPAAINPSFHADVAGSYIVSLVVNDGTVDSLPDTVSISTVNVAPIADAGPDQAVFVGETVTLDGSQSTDADGDLLTYRWSLAARPPGSTAALNDPMSVNPSFSVDVAGSYVVSLTVNDGTVESLPDTLSVSTINIPPIANAGDDQTVFVGDLVTLNGSNSADPDGDALSFYWNFTSLPEGSSAGLNTADTANPTFTVDLPGLYVVSLIVNDGNVDSAADTVSVSTLNVAPIADAGPDQAVFVGDMVRLDGSQSMDMDGDPLSYSWRFNTLPAGSTAFLDDPALANPTFNVDVAGVYSLSLVVNDGALNSVADTVNINTVNVAPVADAGPDQSVLVGDSVTLDGSQSSDADGDSLSYSWSFTNRPAGSLAQLGDHTAVSPDFTPDMAGIYILNLVINDGTVDSVADSVTVSAVTVETAVIAALQDSLTTLNNFDPGVFKKKRSQKKLTNRLNTVINAVEKGKTVRAIRKLDNILKKTDGCASNGTPDKNDWIIDCASQDIFYSQLIDIIELMERL